MCIRSSADGPGLSVCGMREQDQGKRVQEVRWSGIGVCERQKGDTQRSHTCFPSHAIHHTISHTHTHIQNIITTHCFTVEFYFMSDVFHIQAIFLISGSL